MSLSFTESSHAQAGAADPRLNIMSVQRNQALDTVVELNARLIAQEAELARLRAGCAEPKK